ncbi:hypothetical protein GGQ88_004200 [Novosphingobium hassiacum]|uniref:Uncharacterized protein n=1 Tax=Novosphingobium hassiacum TaxID=173676 RepID=A0A7W6A2J6_9SPHN|nr:hypothetical protein [Novosphingobium hassiacum]MBB3862897.1 hypothetical protein [Novosphingobium hassiacum]
MINSVSNTSFLKQSAVSYSVAAKDSSFAQTLASSTSSGTKVTISDAAKAKANTADFDFDFNYSVNHTHEEYQTYLSEGAKNVSQQQGLPEGQYDFSRMSAKQAMVVMNDAIVNRGVSLDDIGVLPGFSSDNMTWQGGKAVYSDTPMDAFSHVLSQKISKDGEVFGISKETLAWMTSVQSGQLSPSVNTAIFDVIGTSPNSNRHLS